MSRIWFRAMSTARASVRRPLLPSLCSTSPIPPMREQAQASVAINLEDDDRQATALAIAETQADILALQEVDNLGVLAPLPEALRPCRDGYTLRPFAAACTAMTRAALTVPSPHARGWSPTREAIMARSHHEATFAELGVFDEALSALRHRRGRPGVQPRLPGDCHQSW